MSETSRSLRVRIADQRRQRDALAAAVEAAARDLEEATPPLQEAERDYEAADRLGGRAHAALRAFEAGYRKRTASPPPGSAPARLVEATAALRDDAGRVLQEARGQHNEAEQRLQKHKGHLRYVEDQLAQLEEQHRQLGGAIAQRLAALEAEVTAAELALIRETQTQTPAMAGGARGR